jgi:hypothetical protein
VDAPPVVNSDATANIVSRCAYPLLWGTLCACGVAPVSLPKREVFPLTLAVTNAPDTRYIQSKNGQNVTTPGYFGNNSQVHGVVATFGTHAQCDALCTANKLFGSSCAACIYGENGAHPDSLGYKVDLQGFKAVGFPWTHDYTECAAFDRHKNPCSYWPSQGTSDQQ